MNVSSGLALCLLAAIGLAAWPAPSQAAVITENLGFSLGSFLDANGATPPPLTTLSGSVSVTFDPTVGYNNDTADIVVHTLSYPGVGSTVGFSWSTGFHVLSVGGIQNGAGDIGSGSNDFVIQFNLADLNAPRLSLCSDPGFTCGSLQGNSSYTSSGYTVASDANGFWLALAGNAQSVPEPSGVALLAAGLGALAWRGRRRA